MNVEFHYYTINFLARRAGFSEDDAETIAFSSQFVDHNIISYRILTDRGEYLLEPTQNYGFWDDSFPREVYVPLHFFPGEPDHQPASRVDGKKNPFNTTPNSPRVKELLVSALKSRNLFRIGIALHTYADSWAHQNFSGRLEAWNSIDGMGPIPPIGHAQAISRPDDASIIWEDPRLLPEHRRIANRDRFLRAARQIYKYLCTYNQRGFDDLEFVEWELEEILGTPTPKSSTSERISDFIIHDTMTPYLRNRWLDEAIHLPTGHHSDEEMFRGYSKVLWLRDALLYRSRLIEQHPVRAKEGFYGSRLHLWHEAANDHRSEARRILSDLSW